MKIHRTIAAYLVAVLMIAGLGAEGAFAASPECGDTLTADTTLEADLLACEGTALVIGADGITLDLNGHTLSSADGEGVGVDNSGGFIDVTIKNGVIDGFKEAITAVGARRLTLKDLTIPGVSGSGALSQTFSAVAAIHIMGGEDVVIEDCFVDVAPSVEPVAPDNILVQSVERVTVDNVHVVGGGVGLHLTSCGTACAELFGELIPTRTALVTECTVASNVYGIAVSNGIGVRIEGNRVEYAFNHGIQIGWCCEPLSNVPLSNIEILSNKIFGSTFDGIRASTEGPDHLGFLKIAGNEVYDNGRDGVALASLRNSIVGKNTVTDNGQFGISLRNSCTDNTITENTARRNQIDLSCTPDSSLNIWENNCFVTKDWADIGEPACCEMDSGDGRDCNGNGQPDACDLSSRMSRNCNENDFPDECDILRQTSQDVNENGVPDECEVSAGNFGFEDPALADRLFIENVSFPGWSVLDPVGLTGAGVYVGVWNPGVNSYPNEASEGDNVGYILPEVGVWGGEVALSQIRPEVLTANKQYTLKVDVGVPLGAGSPIYRVELRAGGTVLSPVSPDENDLAPVEGSFRTSVVEFTAPHDHPNLGGRLEIRLVNVLKEPGGAEVDFDNVRLEVSEPPPTVFLRGDCNDDGNADISDAVCILNWLFLGGTAPGCVAVTNTNGDARSDISDATYLLNHLFLGGPAPVPPYPDCGPGKLPTDADTCQTPPANCLQ